MNGNTTKRAYDRIAGLYDVMEYPMEFMFFAKWRKELLTSVSGKVLEVGIGTGKNLRYYPPGIQLMGIDISSRMMRKAQMKAAEIGHSLNLMVMNVEDMSFSDFSFDFVVSTFVFCSVSRPLQGLREIKRVLKSNGYALFLEHVRSEKKFLGRVMDFFNPMVRLLIGPNINRRTVENIEKSGLNIISVHNKGSELVKHVIARP
ncbi:MAG TPA: class I SAM-dependent methyltransferase [Deltaproteobacteria bacterium]|nr:class I SAM-dependent methyltransferase [Deltaproteobacteria bacterium]